MRKCKNCKYFCHDYSTGTSECARYEDMTEEVMGSSNNWKRMHGYVMHRFKAYGNRRRRASQRERVCLPFP